MYTSGNHMHTWLMCISNDIAGYTQLAVMHQHYSYSYISPLSLVSSEDGYIHNTHHNKSICTNAQVNKNERPDMVADQVCDGAMASLFLLFQAEKYVAVKATRKADRHPWSASSIYTAQLLSSLPILLIMSYTGSITPSSSCLSCPIQIPSLFPHPV